MTSYNVILHLLITLSWAMTADTCNRNRQEHIGLLDQNSYNLNFAAERNVISYAICKYSQHIYSTKSTQLNFFWHLTQRKQNSGKQN